MGNIETWLHCAVFPDWLLLEAHGAVGSFRAAPVSSYSTRPICFMKA